MSEYNRVLRDVLASFKCDVIDSHRGALAYFNSKNGREEKPFAFLEKRANNLILKLENNNIKKESQNKQYKQYERAIVTEPNFKSVQRAFERITDGTNRKIQLLDNNKSMVGGNKFIVDSGYIKNTKGLASIANIISTSTVTDNTNKRDDIDDSKNTKTKGFSFDLKCDGVTSRITGEVSTQHDFKVQPHDVYEDSKYADKPNVKIITARTDCAWELDWDGDEKQALEISLEQFVKLNDSDETLKIELCIPEYIYYKQFIPEKRLNDEHSRHQKIKYIRCNN